MFPLVPQSSLGILRVPQLPPPLEHPPLRILESLGGKNSQSDRGKNSEPEPSKKHGFVESEFSDHQWSNDTVTWMFGLHEELHIQPSIFNYSHDMTIQYGNP